MQIGCTIRTYLCTAIREEALLAVFNCVTKQNDMKTFRDLLFSLQNLSESQLDQEIMIIPTGYCSAAAVEIDGYSPFTGKVELAVSKGDIIFDEGLDSPQCGCGVSGCSDTEEWGMPVSELASELAPGDVLYSKDDVILGPGLPYIRIANVED